MPITFPIDADADLIDICRDWHSGQTSAMYSVLSTGYVHSAPLLFQLVCELRHTARWTHAGENVRDARDKWEAIEDQYILENPD